MKPMTENQIEALAAERTSGAATVEGFDGTYLRALAVGAQAKLGQKRGKRVATETQLAALESVAVPFYAAVLRGVMTPDIVLDGVVEASEVQRRTRERNRRATFARSAKSTLVAWVEAGGDIRGLDATKFTKTELRTAITAANAERGVTSATRVERAQAAILAAVAREGPEVAREYLERVIAALQAAVDELPEAESHGTTTVIRARPGEPAATFRGHMRRVPAEQRSSPT